MNAIKLAVVAILLLIPAPSLAQICVVSAMMMNFGSYNPRDPAPTLTTGTISFRCTESIPVKIKIYNTSGGEPGSTRLTSRNYGLQYELFLNPARTMLWGDGLNGTSYFTDEAPPANTNIMVPVFGEIPPGQQKTGVGAYIDMRTIEIDY